MVLGILSPTPLMGSGGLKVASVSSVIGTGASSSIIIPTPEGTEIGDLLVAVLVDSLRSFATPSGWSSIAVYNNSGLKMAVYARSAPASTGNYTFLLSGGTSDSPGGVLLSIPGGARDVAGAFSTSNPPSLAGVNAQGGLLFAAYRSSTHAAIWSPPAGMAPVIAFSEKPNLAIFSQAIGPGATGTRIASPSPLGSSHLGVLFSVKEN